MNRHETVKEIVSVSEMARMCGLSRARYYQLINEGIFLSPSRNPETGRPFYNRQQQEQCLLIRRTNRGANGRAILFYGRRLEDLPSVPSKRRPSPKRRASRPAPKRGETEMTELRHGLSQLGLADVPDDQIRHAIAAAFPDGHVGTDRADVLRAVFAELKRRDTQDNVR